MVFKWAIELHLKSSGKGRDLERSPATLVCCDGQLALMCHRDFNVTLGPFSMSLIEQQSQVQQPEPFSTEPGTLLVVLGKSGTTAE